MRAPDISILDGVKTIVDQQQLQDAFELKKALAGAQIQASQAALIKAQQPNITTLGQSGFLKAAKGEQPTPDEVGAMRYLSAKTGGIQFDPTTGNAIQKPSLLDQIPLPNGAPAAPAVNPPSRQDSEFNNVMNGLSKPPGTGDFIADTAPTASQTTPPDINQWDKQYQEQRNKLAASGDRNAVHQLDIDYAKAKTSMTEAQSNAATYADRMNLSEPVLNDPEKIKAYADPGQVARAKYAPFTSVFGNYLNNDAYNSFDQAQKDFITAKLRKESGAAINAGEFATDEKTFLPRASDTAEITKQKQDAREAIRNGLGRAAGPAYVPTVVPAPTAPTIAIPPAAAAHLQKNPQLRGEFDAKYGAGASKTILGN